MNSTGSDIKEIASSVIPSVFGGCLTFIFLSQIERFLTMIFVLNFSTSGPNITVVMIFLLATGFVELILPWPHSDRTLSLCMILTLVLIIIGIYPDSMIAAIGSLGALITVTPLIVHEINVQKQKFVFSAGFGIIFQLLSRAWLDSASYYATFLGIIILMGWVILPLLIWFGLIRSLEREIPPTRGNLVDAVPIVTFLMIQYLYLGAPSVISTWFIRDYLLISLTGVLGLSIGLLVALFASRLQLEERPVLWILGSFLLFLASIIDLLWLNLLSILSYFVVQATSMILLFLGLNRAVTRHLVSIRRVGIRMGLIQLLTVIIAFLEISAGNWAFMPSALAWTQGLASVFLFVLALVFPASLFEFSRPKIKIVTENSFSKGVLALLSVLLVITASGVITYQFLAPTRSPSTSSLNVMTYNIHQFYATGLSGQFNLEQVRDVIKESGADIVGLQESEGARITSSNMNGVQWLAHQLGMQFYYYGPPTSAQIYGVSLLSRYPIVSHKWVHLPREVSIERVAIVVEVDTGNVAGQIPIIVTHLQTSGFADDREAQAQAIIDLTQDYSKAILMGDFNTPPNASDNTYNLLNNSFSDAWVLAGNGPLSQSGRTSYFDNGTVDHRIDYIWLKGSWNVLECKVSGTPRDSDHRAVFAQLTDTS